eukprot:g2140.t1
MNRAEAANEEFSNFLDSHFPEDWTMDMPIESAMHHDSLSLASIPNPMDFSFHSTTVGAPVDESTNLFTGVGNSSKNYVSRGASVLNVYPGVTGEDANLNCGFLTDPMLQSVPESDPLMHASVLSMDCDESYGLELNDTFRQQGRYVEYASCTNSMSSRFHSFRPYSMESESSILQSRTNESDSNCSHESNLQSFDSVFNPADSVQETRLRETVHPSTVIGPTAAAAAVLGRKLLEPSLLESSQRSIKMEPDHLMIQNAMQLNPGMMLMQPLPYQSAPQMKLPSLPNLTRASVPAIQSSIVIPQMELANKCFNRNGVFMNKTYEQSFYSPEKQSPQPIRGVCCAPGKGNFNMVQSLGHRDLQTTQSTSNLSCISSNTTGDSTISGKLFDNKMSSKKNVVSKLTPEERQLKILRYKQKRSNRRFNRGVTYQCRKTLADSRPRVRGRFAKNDDIRAIPPKRPTSKVQVNR